ncbi:hypothetical protein QN360_17860 [Glaciimonas sp. CA11.2]|uniref:hypothetical protein n=1 Tax=Glaciimonas sp. CA11.2 TaxID=3048601 RepID=UPI002AB4FFAF|nr:hypothetical protein [Glaciimonas sp. CA11.2]MDY7547472.1 hypothetical protein [Glaciimonas sp. CA11.2]MEB0164764.1 hypothetical protein [Glaciimonas sp. CA11.2]
MKKQIIRIAPLQTAKILAVLYFAITLLLMIVSALITWIELDFRAFQLSRLILSTPILYALCGFGCTLFGAWVYNTAAQRIGGIEFETKEINVARDEINTGVSEI